MRSSPLSVVRASPRWRARVALALVLALAGSLLLVELGSDASGSDAARCERFAETSQMLRERPAEGSGDRVVVIGDSWSAGLGLEDPTEAWPSRLQGQVHVDAFSGSGFSRSASPCAHSGFADRARRAVSGGADVVLVEGGLNDVDQPAAAVRAGFGQIVRATRGAEVVVIGPAAAPARGAGARRVDALLAELSRSAGVGYLSLLDLKLPYLDDGLHLTAAGHRELGDFVAEQLAVLTTLGQSPRST